MSDQPKPPAGPWISSTTSTSGSGASMSLVQEKVGEWLRVLTLVKVLDLPVMSQEESSLITVALEHRHLLHHTIGTVTDCHR